MKVKFTIELDKFAWKNASPEQVEAEIDRINDLLSDEVYVSDVEVEK